MGYVVSHRIVSRVVYPSGTSASRLPPVGGQIWEWQTPDAANAVGRGEPTTALAVPGDSTGSSQRRLECNLRLHIEMSPDIRHIHDQFPAFPLPYFRGRLGGSNHGRGDPFFPKTGTLALP